MISQLFRCFLLISGLILSQELFSASTQPGGQDSLQKIQLLQSKPDRKSGEFFLQASRNLEGFYLDVTDINLHIEDEEEEDHQSTCKRTKTSLSDLFSGASIFQSTTYISRTFSFIFHPAYYQNLTCIRYIRFQVFRL